MCSRDFTALFRAAGVGGDSQMTAMLSRSTKGLRRQLTDDAVPFELPLATSYLESQRAAETAKLELAALERDTALPTKCVRLMCAQFVNRWQEGWSRE